MRSVSSPNGATSCSTSTITATVRIHPGAIPIDERVSLLDARELTTRPVPTGINHLFLLFNVVAMVSCSFLVIVRKYSDYAVAGLMSVVVIQAFGYGLIFDLNFFLRNLSVIGGLLMVLSDSWVRKTKAFAGLPTLDEKDKKMYFQLAGRVLLIFLFIGFVFSGEWSFWRVIVCFLGAGACVMVVVGFKAKYSATLLVVILSVFNLLVNNFWTVGAFVSLSLRVSTANPFFFWRSFMSTTRTRTLPSTTSSRSCPLSAVCCSWSTAAPASSASTRRRRFTKPPKNEYNYERTSMFGFDDMWAPLPQDLKLRHKLSYELSTPSSFFLKSSWMTGSE
jgi:uncharacterized membrane protein YphA (DoxX/SURF4 family)